MGLSGSIAGPLFNLMIGFSFSALKKLYNNKSIQIPLGINIKQTLILNVVVFFIILNSLRLLIQAYLSDFKLSKSISYFGFLIYTIFFIFICYVTFFLY